MESGEQPYAPDAKCIGAGDAFVPPYFLLFFLTPRSLLFFSPQNQLAIRYPLYLSGTHKYLKMYFLKQGIQEININIMLISNLQTLFRFYQLRQ